MLAEAKSPPRSLHFWTQLHSKKSHGFTSTRAQESFKRKGCLSHESPKLRITAPEPWKSHLHIYSCIRVSPRRTMVLGWLDVRAVIATSLTCSTSTYHFLALVWINLPSPEWGLSMSRQKGSAKELGWTIASL